MARTSDSLYVSNIVWQIICTLGFESDRKGLKKEALKVG